MFHGTRVQLLEDCMEVAKVWFVAPTSCSASQSHGCAPRRTESFLLILLGAPVEGEPSRRGIRRNVDMPNLLV